MHTHMIPLIEPMVTYFKYTRLSVGVERGLPYRPVQTSHSHAHNGPPGLSRRPARNHVI